MSNKQQKLGRSAPVPVVGVVPGQGSTLGGFGAFQRRRREEEDDPSTKPKRDPKLVDHNIESFIQELFGDQLPPPPPDPLDPRSAMPSMQFLKEHFKTKSAIIRYLHSKNFAVKDIAKHMNTKYQHVRNVLTNELKRGPNEKFSIEDSDP